MLFVYLLKGKHLSEIKNKKVPPVNVGDWVARDVVNACWGKAGRRRVEGEERSRWKRKEGDYSALSHKLLSFPQTLGPTIIKTIYTASPPPICTLALSDGPREAKGRREGTRETILKLYSEWRRHEWVFYAVCFVWTLNSVTNSRMCTYVSIVLLECDAALIL